MEERNEFLGETNIREGRQTPGSETESASENETNTNEHNYHTKGGNLI